MCAARYAAREIRTVAENPYRSQVLSWYRRCLRAAFTVPWSTDEDALYILEETRRLFHQNRGLKDLDGVTRKLREVEMRYEMAIHYRTPYPRPFHKVQGALQESAVPYAAYLDSAYDHEVNPNVGVNTEGSSSLGLMGGAEKSSSYFEDIVGFADVEGRSDPFDTEGEPTSTAR